MLTTVQKRAVEKFNPLLVIQCDYLKEIWVSNGKTHYRVEEGETLEATPTQTYNKDAQWFESVMGTIDHNTKVDLTGFTFDANLIEGKGSYSVMLSECNRVKSVFLVDTELLKKVKPKKGETYLVARNREGYILYNSARTIGVHCCKDEQFSKIIEDYGDMFAALLTMIKFKGEMVR